jgi:hypothetical protein
MVSIPVSRATRVVHAGQWWVPVPALAWIVVATFVYLPWAGAGFLAVSPLLWLTLVAPVYVARRVGGARSPQDLTVAYTTATIGVWVTLVAVGFGYWLAADPDPTRLPGAPAVPYLAGLVLLAWGAQLVTAVLIRRGLAARD